MAKVFLLPNHKEWEQKAGEDFNAYYKRQEKMYAELKATGKVISFPVADGGAHYHVHSMKPLQLCHIPIGDAYHANHILLRGLRASDVKQMLAREAGLAKLFARA